MDKKFKVQINYALCRSCNWIMDIVREKWLRCSNPKCEEFGKYFQVITSVAEIPMDQAMGESIPGVNEEGNG